MYEPEEMASSSANFEEVELQCPTATDEKSPGSSSSRHKDVEFTIALVGEVGTGKTSFFNAIKRLNNGDEEAAGTYTETATRQCYQPPFKPNIELYDHPGLDTLHSNAKNYCKAHSLGSFDAFLIFLKERIRKIDQDLVKELTRLKKPFYVVRTNVDVDLKRENQNKDAVWKKIEEDIFKNLPGSLNAERVFLISDVLPEKGDFNRLNKAIAIDLYNSLSKAAAQEKQNKSKERKTRYKKLKQKVDLDKLRQHCSEALEKIMSDIKFKGIQEVQKKIKTSLDKCDEVEIDLAVVGISGSGKSSFINAMRGVRDEDKDAAETGVVETTAIPRPYPFPSNPKITLWDLPGIGLETHSDFKFFSDQHNFAKYDVFIIIASERFTARDKMIADGFSSISKPFLFARSKIDQDIKNEENKSSFDEKKILKKIKDDCFKNLKDKTENDIFLISSKHPHKWDFPRLTTTIKNRLSALKQECYTLFMCVLSDDILEEKVKELRGKVWMVAFLSVIWKVSPTSRSYDLQLIKRKLESYITQLGLPKQDSEEFNELSDDLQEELRTLYLTRDMDPVAWLKKFDPCDDDEDVSAPPTPWLNHAEALDKPFKFVYRSLRRALDEMASLSSKILEDTKVKGEERANKRSEAKSE